MTYRFKNIVILYSSKKNISNVSNANIIINQRNNICKTCKNDIVVEDLNYSIFSATEAASFSCIVDSNNSLFAETFWIRFTSLSFEVDRLSRYWLKISNDIFSFLFFLKTIFWCFRTFLMIATTFHKLSISLMWKQFKAKSIAKNSK